MRGMKLRTESKETQSVERDQSSYTKVSPENALLGHMYKSLMNLQHRKTLHWQEEEHLAKSLFSS